MIRCPEARPISAGVLDDFKLEFRSGFLTITPEAGKKVPIGIWEISEQDERNLDIYEGFPEFYKKVELIISDDQGQTQYGMAYVMRPGRPIQAPTDSHFHVVYQGYRDFHLDRRPLLVAYNTARLLTPED